MRPIITLTTDFGISSPYVAQMKAEILARNREALLIDITHAIGPQNILEGSLVWDDVARRFPAGTIHLAVVDPGVGTPRSLLYAEIGGQHYLAPDNGLLTLLARRSAPSKVIELREPRFWNPTVSHTFHGRDILAPVAGHLSLGLAPERLGPATDRYLLLTLPLPRIESDYIIGQILMTDSLGNLITNIDRTQLEQLAALELLSVTCHGRTCGISRTYGDQRPGELVALLDSQGRLEIAVVNGKAAQLPGMQVGTSVVVRRR